MVKLCPICQQPLSELERWGVQIDVCQRCQGVWLDRGELEQIVGFIRASVAAGAAGNNEPIPPAQQRYRQEHDHEDDRDDDHYDHRGGYDQQKRRKRGFEIGDLFDIFG